MSVQRSQRKTGAGKTNKLGFTCSMNKFKLGVKSLLFNNISFIFSLILISTLNFFAKGSKTFGSQFSILN